MQAQGHMYTLHVGEQTLFSKSRVPTTHKPESLYSTGQGCTEQGRAGNPQHINAAPKQILTANTAFKGTLKI